MTGSRSAALALGLVGMSEAGKLRCCAMSSRETTPLRWHTIAVALIAVVLLILAAVVLVPASEPALPPTSVLNVLFDNRWMIGGVRLVGLVVAAYLVLSIFARAVRGQWLKRVGPADAETEDTVSEVTEDQGKLQQDLNDALETIKVLRSELAANLELIDSLTKDNPGGASAAVGGGGGSGP